MLEYRNTKTGVIVKVHSEVRGDWELVTSPRSSEQPANTPEEKPEGEKPEEEADNIRSLVKACHDRVKACEEAIKELAADVKECLSDVKEIVKELKEDVMEIEEEPENKPEGEILEVEP